MNANIRFLVKVLKRAQWNCGYYEENTLKGFCNMYHRYSKLSYECEQFFNSTLILTDVLTPELIAAQLSRNIEKHFFKNGERGGGTNEEKRFYDGVVLMLNNFVEECKTDTEV